MYFSLQDDSPMKNVRLAELYVRLIDEICKRNAPSVFKPIVERLNELLNSNVGFSVLCFHSPFI